MSISPQATLLDATKLMHDHSIGALLVVEEEKLLGILAVSDILRIVIEQHET